METRGDASAWKLKEPDRKSAISFNLITRSYQYTENNDIHNPLLMLSGDVNGLEKSGPMFGETHTQIMNLFFIMCPFHM